MDWKRLFISPLRPCAHVKAEPGRPRMNEERRGGPSPLVDGVLVHGHRAIGTDQRGTVPSGILRTLILAGRCAPAQARDDTQGFRTSEGHTIPPAVSLRDRAWMRARLRDTPQPRSLAEQGHEHRWLARIETFLATMPG